MGKSIFETQTCNRCGGSGRYSFNLRDGDMCYGCSGRGEQLTKRGAAAQKYYTDSLSVRTDEVEPGMKLWDRFSGGWREVESVGTDHGCFIRSEDDPPMLTIRFVGGSGLTDYPSSTHRRAAANKAELEQKRAEALEYQSNLTKAGKPYKRKPKRRG